MSKIFLKDWLSSQTGNVLNFLWLRIKWNLVESKKKYFRCIFNLKVPWLVEYKKS